MRQLTDRQLQLIRLENEDKKNFEITELMGIQIGTFYKKRSAIKRGFAKSLYVNVPILRSKNLLVKANSNNYDLFEDCTE